MAPPPSLEISCVNSENLKWARACCQTSWMLYKCASYLTESSFNMLWMMMALRWITVRHVMWQRMHWGMPLKWFITTEALGSQARVRDGNKETNKKLIECYSPVLSHFPGLIWQTIQPKQNFLLVFFITPLWCQSQCLWQPNFSLFIIWPGVECGS